MKVEDICSDYPDIMEKYIKELSIASVVTLDKDLNIIDCNKGFLKVLGFIEKPEGKKLTDFLVREKGQDLKLPSNGEHTKTKITLKSDIDINYVVDCCIFALPQEYILFCEKPLLTGDDVLMKVSELNNELSNITRELSKKNIALKKANDYINTLLRTDPLTGIPNRRLFMEHLEKNYSYSLRHDVPFSVVMADIDHFKEVNDKWGHNSGDDILIFFAQALEELSREEDLAARFGGEEFIILLPNTLYFDAFMFAERTRRAIESLEIPPLDYPLTASFGVSQLKENDTIDSLLKRADEALYRAKREGRNRVCGDDHC